MKKGALQLSINFIVVIILSVVLLAAGLLLLRQFVGGAQDIKTDLDGQTEAQLERLLAGGSEVVVPFNRAVIERGGQKIFGVGVLNINEDDVFSIEVTSKKFIDESGVEGILLLGQDSIRPNSLKGVSIGKNERFSQGILIQVPEDALSGTYIIDVKVQNTAGLVGNVKKIYVLVP